MSDYRIFIGQYSSPTCGEWVDATDAEACDAAIARVGRSGAVEVGAFDSEGLGRPDTESIAGLRALAEYLDGKNDAAARLAYADHVGVDVTTLDREFEDAYQGKWRDEETYTEETFREFCRIPKELEYYVDFEKMARDWFATDYFSVDAPGGVYVFRHV